MFEFESETDLLGGCGLKQPTLQMICAGCQQPAEFKCSVCESEAYCCEDHQKQRWQTHKSVRWPLEIQTSPELKRHWIASRDIAAGDIIICEKPLVYGPRPHIVEEGPVPCVGCFRLIIAERSPRCGGCGWPVCHTSCEGLKDPNSHGLECFFLGLRKQDATNDLHKFYRQDILIVLRCLLLQRKGAEKWEKLLEMEAHEKARGKNSETYKFIEEHVVKYLNENFLSKLSDAREENGQSLLPVVDPKVIHKICGIIDVNAVAISQDAELSALYPTVHLMEHSCICNTSFTFDASQNYTITVRASVPIKKGEHISTIYSFTHALWGTQARREHLRAMKYFDCRCRRCKDPTELSTYLSALRCIGTDGLRCGGTLLPLDPCDYNSDWVCDKCEMRLGNYEVCFLINKIGKEVDLIHMRDTTVNEMRDFLDKILTFLHPHHYYAYSVKHSLVQLYGYQYGYLPNQMSDELLLEKAEICRDLIKVTRAIDPGSARLPLHIGVLLHELCLANAYYIKRKWHVENKKDLMLLVDEAINALGEAKAVLKTESTAAGKKLHNMLENSTKELSKWMDRHKDHLKTLTRKMEEVLHEF